MIRPDQDGWDEYGEDYVDVSHGAAARLRNDAASFQAEDDEVIGGGSNARKAGEWVLLIGAAVAISVLLRVFVLQAFLIPSGSMIPTLEIGDRVLVNKLALRVGGVNRGDVVVFKKPPELAGDDGIDDVIKRVIAKPGDTVKGQGGLLYVNGAPLKEPYLPAGTVTISLPEQVVPEDTLWVMGDNRTDSSDSRVFGPIDDDLLVGKAFLVFWPLADFGTL